MPNIKNTVLTELETLCQENGGILRPVDIVNRAKPADSPLHDCFEWNDRVAGHEYRLWQAREMIRYTVTIIEPGNKSMRVFVSLQDDRKQNGGGYRVLLDVMKSPVLREKLLQEALAELQVFQKKYRDLEELVPVFKAAKRVRRGVAATT